MSQVPLHWRGAPIPGPRATCRVGGWGGVVREFGIRYLVPCHSRARGGANTNVFVGWLRREFYIFSAIIFVIPAKAGIGLGLLLVIFNWGIIQRYIFYSPAIRDINLIDLIPACAGMTRVVCAWALTPLCHREGVKRPWRSSK